MYIDLLHFVSVICIVIFFSHETLKKVLKNLSTCVRSVTNQDLRIF